MISTLRKPTAALSNSIGAPSSSSKQITQR
ncbi:Uncharacterised protein [Vibrio cholerae]|nr:Uncharacterised protein [Vibrio cholerae]